ncbi:adhesion G-protein coupled receptor G2 isoform X3 [Hydra vulgaris]|uniref:adhesion G-protein coupled receptor G2 isoform X3 n=1 Tax=Hydra vulgaris TaxID=6087 RepID=UPI001F5EDD75|nr:adhesion G-protein coupled receptor G2 isoform X2 [Hydra vulgaris]XP_047141690.1 adhesion G-protein coupled receptor G2 isoform X2 [Hydra vulgaris]
MTVLVRAICTNTCPTNASCIVTTCNCKVGVAGNDISNCSANDCKINCHPDAICNNSICVCKKGFVGDGVNKCSVFSCALADLTVMSKQWNNQFSNKSSEVFTEMKNQLFNNLRNSFLSTKFSEELILHVEFYSRNLKLGALVQFSYRVLVENRVEKCRVLINLNLDAKYFVNSLKSCDCCIEQTVGEDSYTGIYNFPVTLRDDVHVSLCVYNASIQFQRRCLFVSNFAIPEWEPAILSNCPSKSEISQKLINLENINVTTSNILNVTYYLNDIVQNGNLSSIYDVQMISSIIKQIINVNFSSEKVTHGILSSIDALITSNTSLIKSANQKFNLSAVFLSLIDVLGKQQTTNVTMSLKNLGMASYITKQKKNSIFIFSMENESSVGVNISSDNFKSTSDIKDYIILPSSLFIEHNETQIYSFIYRTKAFFREQVGVIDSVILSVSVNGIKVENLSNPILMKFSSKSTISGKRNCQFYMVEEQNWTTDGCNTTGNPTSEIFCQCNHLTNFAILLDVDQSNNNPLILSIVTWVGCAISIAGLFITIVSYSAFAELRKKLAPKILIILCVNLLCTLVIFLGLVERTKPRGLCMAVSSLLQFFILSSFFWMAVEGFNLYRMVVKVFNTSSSYIFLLKSSAFGWGLPFGITIITSVSKPEYLGPSSDNDAKICVVRGFPFYLGILLPVCLVMVSNIFILISVLRTINRNSDLHNNNKNKKKVRIVFTCSLLLGTTWLFAVLAVGKARDIFQWLFCIFNSLQGLFIFFFYTVENKKVKEQWMLFMWGKLRRKKTKKTTVNSKMRTISQTTTISYFTNSKERFNNMCVDSKDAKL